VTEDNEIDEFDDGGAFDQMLRELFGHMAHRDRLDGGADPERSFGFVEFGFSDPGREYGRWTGPQKPPAEMADVPLYRTPGAEPFDALHFDEERFSDAGEFYVVSTVNGTPLNPFGLRHGEESAKTAAQNRAAEIANAKYRRIPGSSKQLLYRLWFRTYGEWTKGWYEIVLDEQSGSKAYLRADDARFCFVEWEDEFCRGRSMVDFSGHDLRDAPEGEIIAAGGNATSGSYRISKVAGDWMFVAEERATPASGWLRWRDDGGVLPGITTWSPKY
jgi:hypothetical protein